MLALRAFDADSPVELFSVDESHADMLDGCNRRGRLGRPGLGGDVHADDLGLVQEDHRAVVGDAEDEEAVRCVQTIHDRLGTVVRLGSQVEEERSLERRLILRPEDRARKLHGDAQVPLGLAPLVADLAASTTGAGRPRRAKAASMVLVTAFVSAVFCMARTAPLRKPWHSAWDRSWR